MRTKDAFLTVRLPTAMKQELQAAADQEDRALSKLVERILRAYLSARSKSR